MKRARAQSKLMDKAILELFEKNKEARLVANRYRSIRALLIEKYPELATIEKERLCTILFDAISFDRKLRLFTEGQQMELKQELSTEYQAQELGLVDFRN